MTPAEWHQVKRIIADALERNAPDREEYILQACAGNVDLLSEVRSLLRFSATSEYAPYATTFASGLVLKNRYVLERRLGAGGFAETWLAADRDLHNRRVVAKILTGLSASDAWVLRKFEEELKAIATIRHPGVIAPLDSGRLANGTPFIVIEYVDGESLRQLLEAGEIPLPRVASIVRQIGHALSAVHARQIFHRDLKPENIMVQRLESGLDHVRLIDFGIATVAAASSTQPVATRAVGTTAYMAPEQMLGQVVAATDIYAFGIIAHELITGVRPTSADRLSRDIPKRAGELIDQAQACDPKLRPQSALQFAEGIAHALSASARTHRSLPFAFAAGAAAVLLILVGGFLWSSRPTPPPVRPPVETSTEGERRLPFQLLSESGKPFEVTPGSPLILKPEDRFRLSVLPPDKGLLYVFSETAEGGGLNVLFPTPNANAGSAMLVAQRELKIPERSWLVFDTSSRRVRLWMVWCSESHADLERARRWANPEDRGEVKDEAERSRIRSVMYAAAKPLTRSGGSPEIRASAPAIASFIDIDLKK